MNQPLLVTGATGFVGSELIRRLSTAGLPVRGAGRGPSRHGTPMLTSVGEIDGATDWAAALEGVKTVVHLAARVPTAANRRAANSGTAFQMVNSDGTRRLAEQSAQHGVRRMVFVSSIQVHGNHTDGRAPFSSADTPMPQGDYPLSKLEAEQALWKVARDTGLELVVVRPPLVYGPAAQGNFARLVNYVRSGIPLPLGGLHNSRSLVGLDNLVDLLVLCTRHPRAAGETFLVSDGEDLSTTDLIRGLARAMNRRARLFHVPSRFMRAGAQLLGRLDEVERLIGSLQVDISHTRQTLDWSPPVSISEGLSRAVAT